MRTSLGIGFVLVTALAGCGGSGSSNSGVDGGNAGGDGGGSITDGGSLPPPARGFQIVSKEVTIDPGQEITYCYYFRTPNTEPMVIKKWSSAMTPGSHHMIMFTTTDDVMPPGTLSSSGCGLGGSGLNLPVWQYAAQIPMNELVLPSDDGTGKPLGQEIPANTPGFFQMHYLNSTDAPLTVSVTLNAEAYDAGIAYTRTAAFITYNSQISIPDGVTNYVQEKTCSVPAGSKFWLMSTHAHKQAVKTEVLNGPPASTDVAFESTDWEHPGAATWMTAPFFAFDTDQLTYRCTYNNTTGRTITSGDSAETDEMCMATGYYFPATKPLLCLNNLGPF